jgi:two-component system cell cycle sensor histidine kinase/response regulator CckA
VRNTILAGERAGLARRQSLWLVVGLGGAVLAVASALPLARASGSGEVLLVLGGIGFAFAVLALLAALLRLRGGTDRADLLADLAEADFLPVFVTDAEGIVLSANAAARSERGAVAGRSLACHFEADIAAPGPLFRRIREAAANGGRTVQEIAVSRGHLRISARGSGSGGHILWRIEELAPPPDETLLEGIPAFSLRPSGTLGAVTPALTRLHGGPPQTLEDLLADPPLRPGDENLIRTARGPVPMRAIPLPGGRSGEVRYALCPPDRIVAHPAGFDAIPVPLLTLSEAGLVTSANPPARKLLGDGEVIGQQLSALVEGLGRPVDDWLADIAAGRGGGKPEVVRAATFEELFLQIAVRPVSASGDPGFLAVLSDATQLKTLEMQFVQSQKMQAIGQLAGGVAHDFNNLLTAISGHCDLLLLRHDRDDPDYSDLMQIAQNANRAASLVGQLLAFSRKQTLQLETLDLRDTLGDMTHLLNRLVGEPIRLTLHHDPNLRPIRGDKRQLEQVLMNLVVNARDAMPDGGEITIETETRHLDQPLRRDRATVPPGDYSVVTVRDQGIGIAPDKLPKIFEPFFTTKRTGEGTGLGLSTAYGIVKQSGGFIFADSAPGAGAAFTLFFPAHERAASPTPPAPAVPVAAERPGMRATEGGIVLLVEDEAPVRAFAARALRMRGLTVLEAGNAEEALSILEDEALSVDVFVTDVVMPGLDGPSWVSRALVERPDTRVIFVSGYSEESVTKEREAIPEAVFLPKPFTLAELTRTVEAELA